MADISIIYLGERLDRITQALANEEFQTIQIGKRESSDTDCFVLGHFRSNNAQAVEEAVKRAGKCAGFVLDGTKAGRRGESAPWQVDFKVANLMEADEEFGQYSQEMVRGIGGAPTRMFLRDVREHLEEKGLVITVVIGRPAPPRFTDEPSHIRLQVHLASYDREGNFVSPKTMEGILEGILRELGRPGDKFHVPISSQHGSVICTTVLAPEDLSGLSFDDYLREGEEDDMDAMFAIGERERLYAIVAWVERHISDVAWASAGPSAEERGLEPSTLIQIKITHPGVIRGERTAWSEHELNRAMRKIYSTGIVEPLNDPNNLMEPALRVHNVFMHPNFSNISLWVAPTGKPMRQKIYVKGNKYEQSRRYSGADMPDGIIETEDPDVEWLTRHVVEQTPGFKDKERMKQAIVALKAAGLDPTWITQYPLKPASTGDSQVEVQLCIRHKEPTAHSHTHPVHERKVIAQVIEAYWTLTEDVEYQWSSGNDTFRVFVWAWLSHDPPDARTTFTMRDRNDWQWEALQMLKPIEDRAVMESDPPMEDEPDMDSMVAATFDRTDPTWRDKERIRNLGHRLKAMGITGRIVQGTTLSDVPYIGFVKLQGRAIEAEMREAVMQALLASGLWDTTQVDRIKGLYKFGYYPDGSPFYSFQTPYQPLLAHDHRIEINIGEGVRYTHEQLIKEAEMEYEPSKNAERMMRTLTRRAIYTPETVVIGSCVHLKEFLKRQGRAGWLTLTATRYRRGTKVELMVRMNLNTVNPEVPASGATAEAAKAEAYRWSDVLRRELLVGGLKRYYPRRIMFSPWPQVSSSDVAWANGAWWADFIYSFRINKPMEEMHHHWPNIQESQATEAEREDKRKMDRLVARMMKRAYPDMADQGRVKALADELHGLGFTGWVRIQPDYGRRLHPGKYYGSKQKTGWLTGSLYYGDLPQFQEKEQVIPVLAGLLAKHGFGGYTQSFGHRYMNVQWRMDDNGRQHWDFVAPEAYTSTMNIEDTYHNLGEAEEPDPETFLNRANQSTVWDNRIRIMTFASALHELGYIGTIRVYEPSWASFTARKEAPVPREATALLIGQIAHTRIAGPHTVEDDVKTALSAAAPEWQYGQSTTAKYRHRRLANIDTGSYEWHFDFDAHLPIHDWKESGDVIVDLATLEFSVDVKM